MAEIPLRIARQELEAPVALDYPSSYGRGEALASVGKGLDAIAVRLRERQEENDRFKARVAYEQFGADIERDFTELQTQMAPDGTGFHDGFVGQLGPNGETLKEGAFDARRKAFLEQVPESMRGRYDALSNVDRTQWSTRAATVENDQRNTYFRTATQDTLGRIASNIAVSDPSDLASYDAYRAKGESLIQETGLSPAEKDVLTRKWRTQAAETAWKRLAEVNPAQARAAIGLDPSPNATAKGVIRHFEGFRAAPYYDVNAFRAGYGSDTVTHADGTVEKVTPRTRVTQEDAERDLDRRTSEFEGQAAAKVGPEVWAALPNNIKAALTSVTYNYGEIPDRIVPAVRTGDPQQIAKAVEALGSDNEGANLARRKKEAAIIAGTSGIIDDRFADMGPDAVEAGRATLAKQDGYIRAAVDDDISSLKNTGKGLEIDPMAARAALSQREYDSWQSKRRAAAAFYQNTSDLATMPDAEIEARLLKLKPEAGTPGFEERQSVFEEVTKEAAEVTKLRREDAAASVRQVPEVREAYAAIEADKPDTIQNALKVSLEAQARAGIPAYARRPITVKEARDIAMPLIAAGRLTGRDDVSKDETTALRTVVTDIMRTYGPYAKDVLPHVIEETSKDRQMGPLAASIFRKIVSGEKITARDRQNLEVASDAGNASRAIGATEPVRDPAAGKPLGRGKGAPAAKQYPAPNPNHIRALLEGAGSKAQFEEKFGPGSAEPYLAAQAKFGAKE